MAARLNPKNCAEVRTKINASLHLTNLGKNATGKMEMDPIQQRSAIFLVEQSIGKAPQHIQQELDGSLTISCKS